jgi:hypothetical protein
MITSCTTTSTNLFSTSQLVQDVNLISNSISPLAISIENLSGFPAIQAQINALLPIIKNDAKTISTDLNSPSTHIIIQDIIIAVNSIINIAAALPLPEPYLSIHQALVILLPVVETEAGFQGNTKSNNIDESKVIQARLTLQGAIISLKK